MSYVCPIVSTESIKQNEVRETSEVLHTSYVSGTLKRRIIVIQINNHCREGHATRRVDVVRKKLKATNNVDVRNVLAWHNSFGLVLRG